MRFIRYFVLTIIYLTSSSSITISAEWKNPDLQKSKEWQSPDQIQPITKPERSNPLITNNLPSLLKGEMGVDAQWICNLQHTYNDKGSGGRQDVRFYQPVLPTGYSMLGGYAQGNHFQPNNCILAVKPINNESNALLRTPQEWKRIWTDKNSGGRMDGSIWHPESYDTDYICLGSIAIQGYSKPNLTNYVCLHQCLVEENPITNYIWSDRGTGASQDVSIYKLHNSNGFYAVPSHSAPKTLKDIRHNTICKF